MESIEQTLDRLEKIYDAAVARLREDVIAFGRERILPAPERRSDGSYAYPELRLRFRGGDQPEDRNRAFGRLNAPGLYTTTVTRPVLFRDYLREQLELIDENYEVELEVGSSKQEIPFPYVLDGEAGAELVGVDPNLIARHFPSTELADIGDELADGIVLENDEDPIPLSLFDGLRTDFSLARLAHYTGTSTDHFQRFILFTNYHRYVDAFVDWAVEQVKDDSTEYEALSAAGFVHVDASTEDPVGEISGAPWRRFQMPAYHLKSRDGRGITLVNIGVGPSNAKNITDHLAVLRPECWMMIGHCGGLRHSQRLGDYVLAHAYLRYDSVLDRDLPVEIPIPPIAEIQLALQEAVESVSGDDAGELKRRLRTGTVVTYADRNWELRYTQEARRINQSRSIAVDMESATIAANGFRLRVPYGTLLCVSDKPLHGELKLPGAANRFYAKSVSEHLAAGIEAVEVLKRQGADALHSRKLRSFDEPPFR